MARLAFLGLGAMGSRMAARLIDAGHEVRVWNRTGSAAEPLVARGAVQAGTPREAAEGAEAVFAMLRDDAASHHVWQDPETGAFAGIKRGALVIESSTLTPERARAWAEAARAAGARPVEAPVSGSRPHAEDGNLVYFLGGEAPDVAAARYLLGPLAAGIHAVGPVGAGAVVKLVTNTLLATQVAAWAELLPLMRAQGLDLEAAFSALSSTAAWAPAAGMVTGLMREAKHAPNFPVELIHKDMRYTAGLAPDDVLPMTNFLRQRFEAAIDAGFGAENMTALIKLTEGAEGPRG